MNPAQHQLQPLQVVVMLLLLPQLPPQVCHLASNATDALGVGIDCYCHLCNALTATVICAMPPTISTIAASGASQQLATPCNGNKWNF